MRRTRLLPQWLLDITDRVEESLWFLPVALTIGTAAGSFALLTVDHFFGESIAEWLPFLELSATAGVESTLGTIASSIITLTGVVFSITLVVLTLASQQFGPRLLRNFVRDRATQFVLGTFVATFLHALIVRHALNWSPATVPRLAVHSVVLLAAFDAVLLVYFIHHVGRAIHVSTVVRRVADEFSYRIELLPMVEDAGIEEAESVEPHPDPVEVRATTGGYVRVIDFERLIELARRVDGHIEITTPPGDFVLERVTLARVHTGQELDEASLDQLRATIALGDRRTTVQDLRFSIDQLVELALRALSPGVNDPETAVACVDRLGQGVAWLAQRRLPDGCHRDADGVVRVVAAPTRFEDLVTLCFARIRRACTDHVEVGEAIDDSLRRAAEITERAAARQAIEHARVALEEPQPGR